MRFLSKMQYRLIGPIFILLFPNMQPESERTILRDKKSKESCNSIMNLRSHEEKENTETN